ncbi:CarD family transcriptional regulator [candidate division CSSED10-310 bacterium]|uniref:CarD family transcriptional regulator n=1 Tax=candidate division CSSED10-310 bacterium TaxID=2855610 RepID=A0ABV6YRI2_UNCC1
MFCIGDSVIYPTHGLAEVEAIEEKSVLGNRTHFYVLRVQNKDMSVLVPTGNEEKIGLRAIIKPEKVPDILEILKEKPSEQTAYWHQRYSENYQKMKTGSIFETAKVFRDLIIIKKEKKLSVKETRMMENAKELLTSEMAFSLDCSCMKVEHMISIAIEENPYLQQLALP